MLVSQQHANLRDRLDVANLVDACQDLLNAYCELREQLYLPLTDGVLADEQDAGKACGLKHAARVAIRQVKEGILI